MNTPLVDIVIERAVDKALWKFVNTIFNYEAESNIYRFPAPADLYGSPAEYIEDLIEHVKDTI